MCLFSCSRNMFLQRKYTGGIFVEHTTSAPKTKIREVLKNAGRLFPFNSVRTVENDNGIAVENKNAELSEPGLARQENKSCADTIVLRNEVKITCRVSHINDDQIKYESCNPNPTLRNLPLNEIYCIRFKNGVVEKFNERYPIPVITSQQKYVALPQKPIGFSLFGYIFAMLGGGIMLFAFAPAGFLIILLAILGAVIVSSKPKLETKRTHQFVRGLGIGLGVIGITCFALLILAIMALTAFL